MKKINLLAAVAALSLLASCSDSSGSSSEKTTSNENNGSFNSSVVLACDEDVSDDELLAAENAIARRFESTQANFKTSSDKENDTVTVEFEKNDKTDALLKTITDKNEVAFRLGTDKDAEKLLGNEDIKKTTAVQSMDSVNDPKTFSVNIDFTEEAGVKFEEITEKAMMENLPLSIYVNDELISSPTVTAKITTGSTVITGDFTLESAEELADLINSGTLRCNMHVVE